MPKQKLTQKFVERITPPKTGKVDYFDTEVPGLMLRILSSGTRTFACRYREPHGKQVERKLASAKALRLTNARQQVLAIQAKLAMGEDPFEARRTLKEVPTFAAFIETTYMPHVKSYKRSWETDECLLRNHALPHIGNLYLDEIKRQHVVEIVGRLAQHLKPASVNRFLLTLRYALNCAVQWEVAGITRNPTAGVPLLKENNQRDRYLSEDEAVRLFQALEASPNPLLPHIVAMLLLTGARRREVLSARWSDIDVAQRQWRIEFNKTGKTRYVPVSERLLSLLAKVPRMDNNDYLFPNPKTGKPFVAIFQSWDTARRKAGLEDVHLHDLRHSFASFLINRGHSLYEVQKLLGHTQIKTTQRYAHLSNESLLNAADSAAALVPWGRGAQEAEKEEKTVTDEEAPVKARTKALPEPPASTKRRVLRPGGTAKKETPSKTVSPPHSGEPPDREPST